MKNFLLVMTIVSVFTACQSNPAPSLEINKDMVPVDNAYNSSILTDVGAIDVENSEPVVKATPIRRKSIKKKAAPTPQAIPARQEYPTTAPEAANPVPVVSNAPTTTTESATAGTQESVNSGTDAVIATPKKKGWSDAAKGATIGAVGGAVAGAIISGKNRAKGAIIGGVIGAAGGYVLGRKRDKQSGRVDFGLQ